MHLLYNNVYCDAAYVHVLQATERSSKLLPTRVLYEYKWIDLLHMSVQSEPARPLGMDYGAYVLTTVQSVLSYCTSSRPGSLCLPGRELHHPAASKELPQPQVDLALGFEKEKPPSSE